MAEGNGNASARRRRADPRVSGSCCVSVAEFMKKLLLSALLYSLTYPSLALGQSAYVSGARITWYGTYDAASDRVVKDTTAPGGLRTIARGILPPTANDDRVRAMANTRFGFGYVLEGGPAGAVVPIRHVRRFPPEGILDPLTGERHYSHETNVGLAVGRRDLFVGYALGRDFELVPGPWTFEVWHGERLLLTKTFILYKP